MISELFGKTAGVNMKKYYIVVYWDRKGNIDHFGGLGSENILWNDDPTLFKTYEDARNAIKRTRTYAKKNKMPWDARIQKAVLSK